MLHGARGGTISPRAKPLAGMARADARKRITSRHLNAPRPGPAGRAGLFTSIPQAAAHPFLIEVARGGVVAKRRRPNCNAPPLVWSANTACRKPICRESFLDARPTRVDYA